MMNLTPVGSMPVPDSPTRILVSVSGTRFTQTMTFNSLTPVEREGVFRPLSNAEI